MSGAGGLLDRYVLRRFVAAYGLCLFGFLMLYLVLDFSMHVDKFVDAGPTVEKAGLSLWTLVVEYYATRLVWFATIVGPFLALFAGIAALITFGRHNELTPMIASGRSHHRVLAPIYVFAALTAVALAVLEDRVVPAAMKRNAAIENIIDPPKRGDTPPHLRDERTGNTFHAQQWLPHEQRLLDVRAITYHDPSGAVPDGRFAAAAIAFRRNKQTKEIGWYPMDGTVTPNVAGSGGALPPAVRLPPDRPIAFQMAPTDVGLAIAQAELSLSTRELDDLIARHPQRSDLLMQKLTRMTRPVSSLVLLLLGLPFVTRPGQRTIAAGLGIALGTCGAYMAVDFFFQQLGNRGQVFDPLVSAWFAPAFFGAIALARIDRVAG